MSHITENMPSQCHLEILNQIKPRLKLGISVASGYVTNETCRYRTLIRAPLICSLLASVFSLTYIGNTFGGCVTMNLMMSLMFFMAHLQIILKTLLMRYHRSNLLKLLDKVESLQNYLVNKELREISEKHLVQLSYTWLICLK